MREPRRAAVVGLGLMGGSLARDLAARGVEVWGRDRDEGSEAAARDGGAIRGVLPPSLEGLEGADLLVLAVPVTEAAEVLRRARPRLAADCLVTDLGSTKRSIVEAAQRAGVAERFVGAHPLAGDHRSGWAASRTGLFSGAPVYLCPTPATPPGVLDRARRLWTGLGALPEVMEAEAHDRRMAWASHLPQLAASALARALAGAGVPPAQLGPGGRDATRLAGSSAEMWSAISLDNRDLLDGPLASLIDHLEELRSALRHSDPHALREYLAAGREWAEN